MRIRCNIAYLIGIILLTSTIGCAHTAYPKRPIEPVRRFSLGSAKFTPFKSRPTVDELYNKAFQLYESFNSAAATSKSDSFSVDEWTEEDGKAEDIKETRNKYTTDYRAVQPDKQLVVSHGDLPSVIIRNGNAGIWYFPKENKYMLNNIPDEKQSSVLIAWTHLKTQTPIVSKKLLPDRKWKETPVYVLELRTKEEKSKNGGHVPAEIVTIYIGKKDLLPRRIKSVMPRTGKDARIKGVPEDYDTEEFLGFIANCKIPNDVFSTEPPAGAKRMN